MGIRISDITKEYGGSWVETSREKLDDVKDIASAEVTERDFVQDDGTTKTVASICFHMKNGRDRFKQLDRNSDLEVGDKVDPKSIEVITLERDDDEIYRVDGKKLKKSR